MLQAIVRTPGSWHEQQLSTLKGQVGMGLQNFVCAEVEAGKTCFDSGLKICGGIRENCGVVKMLTLAHDSIDVSGWVLQVLLHLNGDLCPYSSINVHKVLPCATGLYYLILSDCLIFISTAALACDQCTAPH